MECKGNPEVPKKVHKTVHSLRKPLPSQLRVQQHPDAAEHRALPGGGVVVHADDQAPRQLPLENCVTPPAVDVPRQAPEGQASQNLPIARLNPGGGLRREQPPAAQSAPGGDRQPLQLRIGRQNGKASLPENAYEPPLHVSGQRRQRSPHRAEQSAPRCVSI